LSDAVQNVSCGEAVAAQVNESAWSRVGGNWPNGHVHYAHISLSEEFDKRATFLTIAASKQLVLSQYAGIANCGHGPVKSSCAAWLDDNNGLAIRAIVFPFVLVIKPCDFI
jgi:hypothetical protein